jgi:POT family proton-dependent oligopeptide transporter
MGGMIETITAQYSLSTFQFYNSSIGAGLITCSSSMKKLMHGVKGSVLY